jgi:protein-tyrosine phosphatase
VLARRYAPGVTVPSPTRHVELDGCCNFRDLGGYPTTDGRRTRWRRLFRADGLTALTEADLERFVELGIRTVLDLRTGVEVEARGRFRHDDAGIEYHHLPLTDTLPGAEQSADWDDTGFVSARYTGMLVEGIDSIGRALGVLADPANLPAVFHCSVGKDRTGVLAAVVLGLLGVPEEVIVEDYALSKAAMERLLERFRRDYPESADVVAGFAPVILSVEPASMRGFLAGLHATYGSFAGLAEAAGLGPALGALRAELLEPA